MPASSDYLVEGVRWTVTVDTDAQTLTAVAHEVAGDYRLELPLDFVGPLRDAIGDILRDRPDLFPLTHTRRVD